MLDEIELVREARKLVAQASWKWGGGRTISRTEQAISSHILEQVESGWKIRRPQMDRLWFQADATAQVHRLLLDIAIRRLGTDRRWSVEVGTEYLHSIVHYLALMASQKERGALLALDGNLKVLVDHKPKIGKALARTYLQLIDERWHELIEDPRATREQLFPVLEEHLGLR